MIAVDTNLLIYSHRADSEWFDVASKCVRELAEGNETWAIPWPCIHEFLAVVTNPRIFRPPTSQDLALQQVDFWMESPHLELIGEPPEYWQTLHSTLSRGRFVGGAVHDARIAAICQAHGVKELWTADRDFSRVANFRTRNPLVAS